MKRLRGAESRYRENTSYQRQDRARTLDRADGFELVWGQVEEHHHRAEVVCALDIDS